MVETIINTIDLAIQSIYPTAKYYGLSRRENNGEEQTIFKYKGYGSNDYVGFDDTYPINVYHRVIGAPETSDLNSGFGVNLLRQTTYNMRLVVFGDMRKVNDGDCDINYTVAPNISAKIPNRISQNILDLIGVKTATIQVTRTEFDRPTIFNNEMTGVEYKLHPETLLFAIDYNIRITYDPKCVIIGCEPVIPKVTVIDGATTVELTAPSEYTCSIVCDPATVTATNSLSTVLGTVSAPSGGTGNIPISDSPINKSDGTLIANVPAETSYNVADSVITVEYVNGTPISTTNVKATDTATIQIPNPATLQETIDANTANDIGNAINNAADTTKPSGIFVVTAPNVSTQAIEDGLTLPQRNSLSRTKQFKIGETPVVYQAGDFGTYNRGRGASFLTLSVNNPNGNTNRFELLGTDVVIDWGLGCYWTKALQANAILANHISTAAALTLEGLSTWYVPGLAELSSICDMYLGDPLNYAPFNLVIPNFFLLTSEYQPNVATSIKSMFFYGTSRGCLPALRTTGQSHPALYIKPF